MDPKNLPEEYRKPYIHLLISRLSVDAIPNGAGVEAGVSYIASLLKPGKLTADLQRAATVIDPMLTELAAATARETGKPCTFGQAAAIADAEIRRKEDERFPWRKAIREAKEATGGQ